MGRHLLLGLDVGTTATKVLVVDLRGHSVAAATQPYGLITPRPGWVEQDPEDLWRAVVAAVRAVAAQLEPGDRVVALSIASQGGTTIPVDAAGAPTYHAISWMDQRGEATCDRARGAFGADRIQTITGWPLGRTLPLQHIAWLQREQPDVVARTARFLFVNDYIGHRLTHRHMMNPSDATMTQLFDIEAVAWHPGLLNYVGIKAAQVSEVRPSGEPIGHLTGEARRELGLPADMLVVNGAHDQYCAAVGTGVTEPGAVLLSCGTAWVILAVPDSLEVGRESGMALSCHALPGRWGAIRSLGGIGTAPEWLLHQVWDPDDRHNRTDGYAAINQGAARVAFGAEDLIFIPMSGGHVTEHVGGGFLNLDLSHTRDALARAVMEGVTYESRWALDEIQHNGIAVDALTMVGGAAGSPIWPQIVADVVGVPVTVPAEREAAALGAAVLAGVGAGCFDDIEAGIAALETTGAQVAPDPVAGAAYDEQFATYQRLYAAVTGASG